MRYLPILGLVALSLVACNGGQERNAGPNRAPTKESPMSQQVPGPGETFQIHSGRDGVPAIEVEVVSQGDGMQPLKNDTVAMHYTGTLDDGSKFDSSRDRGTPFEFRLGAGQVIPGWDLVVAKMRVGDRWVATIPYQLAYGDRGYPGAIPPRANLAFDMELMRVR